MRSYFPGITRTTALLIIAGVFQILALLNGLPVRACFEQPFGLVGAALVVAGAYCAALGVRKWADEILRSPVTPWYDRPGALPFLTVTTLLICALSSFLMDLFCRGPLPSQGFPHIARVFQFGGLVLFWTALLDWPRRVPVRRIPTRYIPPQPSAGDYYEEPDLPPQKDGAIPKFKPLDQVLRDHDES